MLYGRSDIQSVKVPETGHFHDRPIPNDPDAVDVAPFVLNCPECEPVILRTEAAFWARTREEAPLTEAEVKQRERMQEQMLLGQMSEFEEFRRWQASRRGALVAG